jgi:ribose 5-phosphate isomerase A
MDEIKQKLGETAANLIKDKSVIGLGTGSTAKYFIKSLAKRCSNGLSIRAVSSSKSSERLAKNLGMKIIDLEKINHIDVYVDGADEINSKKQMIKGRGGALLREKILANSSTKVIIIVDYTKYVEKLGAALLPVEVIPFGCNLTKNNLEKLGYISNFRKDRDSNLYITENDNYILDIKLQKLLDDPLKDHNLIKSIPGVVDTGIFIDLAKAVLVGYHDKIERFF